VKDSSRKAASMGRVQQPNSEVADDWIEENSLSKVLKLI
jgi:hypothetical protein